MDHQDRQAIEGLFDKLAEVERRSAPRDSEADAFISSRIAAQPGAPYFMAQTIVVQEQALDAAQTRITDLERQLASRPASRRRQLPVRTLRWWCPASAPGSPASAG
jgi:uncharacterized protein